MIANPQHSTMLYHISYSYGDLFLLGVGGVCYQMGGISKIEPSLTMIVPILVYYSRFGMFIIGGWGFSSWVEGLICLWSLFVGLLLRPPSFGNLTSRFSLKVERDLQGLQSWHSYTGALIRLLDSGHGGS